jgi:GNAT superfamily N-acetyltransferase
VARWASPYLAAQAAYLRHLGTSRCAEVLERDGLYAVRTGVASNTENGVLSAGGAPADEPLVCQILEWMRAAPASWLCAEGEARHPTAQALRAAGCVADDSAWEMRGDLSGGLDDAGAEGVRIAPVSGSGDELGAWLDVAGSCRWFETDAERHAWRDLYAGLELTDAAPLRLHVAFRGDRPVGMASAFHTDGVVLLSAVGVVVDERRHGIGRALAATRLREARGRGCKLAVLVPSPEGAELYRRLGFERHRQPEGCWFYLPVGTVGAT